MQSKGEVLLEIKHLKKYFPVTEGVFKKVKGYVKAVDDVTLQVNQGETLGIVGESGCGKTTLGKCLVRLLKPSEGELVLKIEGNSRNLLDLNRKESFRTRRRVQMIFQDPYSAFNPMINILHSFDEPLKIHGFGDARKRRDIIADMLERVNLQPDYMYRFPHEFSGGQRQRICIARALSLDPEMIVCDEPVSSLDVSIQAQILNLMRKLQRDMGLTYVFIAHDLSVVQYMSDWIAVMYLGKVVELAKSDQLYNRPKHPYTEALLSAVPIPVRGARKQRILLQGDVPSPINPPPGCPFHTRCPKCMDICKTMPPAFLPLADSADHHVACHLFRDDIVDHSIIEPN